MVNCLLDTIIKDFIECMYECLTCSQRLECADWFLALSEHLRGTEEAHEKVIELLRDKGRIN